MVRRGWRSRAPADGDLFAPDDWDGARWDRVPLPDDPAGEPDGARSAAEDEARFIQRLVVCDPQAFNTLVRAYQRRVFALVLRMIGNRAEAEDLAQEVFVQVFKAVGTFRGESKLSTWIYRIAINLCKNRAKYLRVRHAGEQDELEAVQERVPLGQGAQARGANVGQIARPDEMMAGKQVERIVQQAILELEPSFRECLVLRDVEDLSYEEIGAITGLPEGTVKSRIHRARAQLKEIVERALGEKIP
jgi:RNA polymerase sigma-70 factor (ECF subfamily)